jgi:hypothetical protein
MAGAAFRASGVDLGLHVLGSRGRLAQSVELLERRSKALGGGVPSPLLTRFEEVDEVPKHSTWPSGRRPSGSLGNYFSST